MPKKKTSTHLTTKEITSESPESFRDSVLQHLKRTLARDLHNAKTTDWTMCLSMAVRDRMMERYMQTQKVHHDDNVRRVYYLSLEYLMGRMLRNNLTNLELYDIAKEAMKSLDIEIDDLLEEERDMGLGNGGLGRLAACFLDSLATLEYPAIGYGIYYEFGLFKQEFVNNRQVEHPDDWQNVPNPWPLARPEYTQKVKIYGEVQTRFDENGNFRKEWVNAKTITGLPWDIGIAGYGGKTINFLRLWESKASQEFDLNIFNEGGYTEAVREKAIGETISKVLYPNDKTENGKELRLVQQYFFVTCSLKDMIRRYKIDHDNWDAFADKVAIQLNDTHPAVAIPELMRILIDEEGMGWEPAWDLCRKVFAYTNHTLLPEALEKWSVPLFERVLPRHLEIIYEINHQFLTTEVEKKWPGDDKIKSRLSIIEEGFPKMIRMAYLSVIGSHTVNGVAALHTQLLKADLFREFDDLYAGKFQNKTNGITPRRWLKACNPDLSALIDEKIGKDWVSDLDKLQSLSKFATDAKFQKSYMAIKLENKKRLAQFIEETQGITINPEAIFDVQIKRLHEYKRQHLNLLHILALYRRILQNPDYDMEPRVFIFGAKAAPGYDMAKDIILAINAVGQKINNDPRVKDRIKVVFLSNYRVSLAEKIIPAADLSEQISTAGKEASGTGNMKLALNGALTIGTLDGANVEIGEEVGDENIFIFGLTVEEVEDLRAKGYNPFNYYHSNEELRIILDWLGSDFFTPNEGNILKPVRDGLLEGGDPFLVLADFAAYCEAQGKVDEAFRDKKRWAKMAILNTACVGKFSSDRTIREYAEQIWNLKPVAIQ